MIIDGLASHKRRDDEIIAKIREGIVRIGWSETARRSGINRVTLYRTFGNMRTLCKGPRGPQGPSLETILAVLPVIGLRLWVE